MMGCSRDSMADMFRMSRREMLRRAGLGFGTWALLDLLTRDGKIAAKSVDNPLASKAPHEPARAKHVIFLFMQGGPSQIDTFDPKPLLNQHHGQPLPPSISRGLQLQFTQGDAAILGSPQSLRNGGSPVLYLDSPNQSPDDKSRAVLDMTQWLNREHLASRGEDVDDLSSRIASYELAFRMQSAVPEAVDLSRESTAIQKRYGMDDPISERFGRDCLLARRLVERGVRFVPIFTGTRGAGDWDAAHADNDKTHREMAPRTDKPIAALLKDLKSRGLLDETLLICGGEFVRTPMAD